jgi:RNA polymerase sigma-70 factor (ECF subfamily)
MVRVAASHDPPRSNASLLPGEERLIRGAQAGDRAAFSPLVDHYWDRLYRWLYHLTRDRHAAEDLTQDTFMKAFAALKRFEPGTNFGAWLFRIAHNACANHLRGRRRREPLPAELPGHETGPAQMAADREAAEGLAQAVDQLPPDFRAAFLLRAQEDLSFREIADVLGLTEETARWRVFKARQKLLALVAPHLERETP